MIKADLRTAATAVCQSKWCGCSATYQIRSSQIPGIGRCLNDIQEHIVIGKQKQFKNQPCFIHSVIVSRVSLKAYLEELQSIGGFSKLTIDSRGTTVSAEDSKLLCVSTKANPVIA